jgi:hypothetical protein
MSRRRRDGSNDRANVQCRASSRVFVVTTAGLARRTKHALGSGRFIASYAVLVHGRAVIKHKRSVALSKRNSLIVKSNRRVLINGSVSFSIKRSFVHLRRQARDLIGRSNDCRDTSNSSQVKIAFDCLAASQIRLHVERYTRARANGRLRRCKRVDCRTSLQKRAGAVSCESACTN